MENNGNCMKYDNNLISFVNGGVFTRLFDVILLYSIGLDLFYVCLCLGLSERSKGVANQCCNRTNLQLHLITIIN